MLITFRSFIIPAILVLIVQCLLMGATIDYGILFTNYYRNNRKALDLRDAIESSYEGALHTILTSALIMMILTAVMGFVFRNPAI